MGPNVRSRARKQVAQNLVTAALALAGTLLSAISGEPARENTSREATEERRVTGVRDVHPRVRLPWLILQAVPSPGIAMGERGFHGMMSWQLTPFLYSWAMDSRLVPFRYFVVEPIIRQSGSLEWFVSPLYLGRGSARENVGVRTGVRAYIPITERGDGWSVSLGASASLFPDVASPSLDLGVYTLFGGLGLVATVSPWFNDSLVELGLRVRYF
jgi:hypothetical protein